MVQSLWQSLTFVGLTTVAVLLFAGVGGLAVWRAFSEDSFPPTPTIPAGIAANFAYVSELTGTAESQPPGEVAPVSLQVGDTVAAGQGALLRTGDESRLRLGLPNDGVYLLGTCTLTGGAGESVTLYTGEHSWVQGFDPPQPPGPADYLLFMELGDPGAVPTPTPSRRGVTPLPLPTLRPSPTAGSAALPSGRGT
ncbi:MAG: hypothetical protein L0332_01765 [Chloroflexi bacterium]|nr:hypothetical protein [Chloroflexota bacterium]MCI0577445.1 hypothetical protein [Chloroflexota bacterium]MCI0649713.1 hypothetical protein [Chloroflexota bacterium]MCI0725443.1 hypothetical protein [Chloroflexota bacterium]